MSLASKLFRCVVPMPGPALHIKADPDAAPAAIANPTELFVPLNLNSPTAAVVGALTVATINGNEPPEPWTTDTAPADQASLATSLGLVGNVDYEFELELAVHGTPVDYKFVVNAGAGDAVTRWVLYGVFVDMNTAPSTLIKDTGTGQVFVESGLPAGSVVHVYGRITQVAGAFRVLRFWLWGDYNNIGPTLEQDDVSTYQVRIENTDPVTTFSIDASTGDGVGSGSVLRMRRAVPTP